MQLSQAIVAVCPSLLPHSHAILNNLTFNLAKTSANAQTSTSKERVLAVNYYLDTLNYTLNGPPPPPGNVQSKPSTNSTKRFQRTLPPFIIAGVAHKQRRNSDSAKANNDQNDRALER